MFNPNRLTVARKRRKLTGKALAAEANVSPVTISRIEKGINEPDDSTIESFVRVLEFPAEFFFGEDIDELPKGAASFRSLTSMTAKERDAAISAGQIAYLIADWIADRFNLPLLDVPDLGYEGDPAAAARSLREYWGLGEKPIGSMVKLLESRGVMVFSLSESTKNVNAFSCWRDGVPFVFLNTFKTAESSRFDAAHELGHLVLHKNDGPCQGRGVEIEANAFAASFLMPSADVRARIPVAPSIERLISDKKRWRVSLRALGYRLHKLSILSDWQYRSFCIEVNRRFRPDEEPEGIERESSIVLRQVFSSLWADGVTKNHIAKDLGLPISEVEGLVFGLMGNQGVRPGVPSKPHLTVV